MACRAFLRCVVERVSSLSLVSQFQVALKSTT